ncbi:Uncharacterised protein [Raoultella planticola]|uniref:Uncharacterized protein n=1 Tax=Raoultella planticola TaxID=575 RepID=A0A485B5P6_RAOPL|nr:Uncharacterised protein [Raoultella planticola]
MSISVFTQVSSEKNLLRKSVSLFLSVCLSSLLSFIFFVLSEILLNKHSTENTLLLAKALSQCSIIIFSSVLVVRLIIRCFFNRKKLHVAILGITLPGWQLNKLCCMSFQRKSIENQLL